MLVMTLEKYVGSLGFAGKAVEEGILVVASSSNSKWGALSEAADIGSEWFSIISLFVVGPTSLSGRTAFKCTSSAVICNNKIHFKFNSDK